jgi:alpha-N-acetylglucosaminidase
VSLLFQDWSNHLDWMALNGINLALASSGQEMIWLKTYQSLGLTSKSIEENYFAGKAFLPWNRMGNLKSWAGPLNLEELQYDVDLQHKILGQFC